MSTRTSTERGPEPLRVAILNDYEVVLAGLRAMLAPFSERIVIVELLSQVPVRADVDVLLYDAFGRERVTGPAEHLVRETNAAVVLYTWHLSPDVVHDCLAAGMAGCISKTIEAEDLVEALEKVHGGSLVVIPDAEPEIEPAGGDWPGRSADLTSREAEVIALIAQGLTNQEIADRAYLSINSVKTYIRSAYRKIGVERRSQAVLWATRNGFLPDVSRMIIDPD